VLVLVNAALSVGCASDDEIGPICDVCADGGQTSDFGAVDGCSLGDGPLIDLVAARELGFEGLESLERDFEVPLTWTPQPANNGDPATGYQTNTILHGRTRFVSVEHVEPTMSGCEDFVRVTLDLELSTADQALRITDHVISHVHRGDLSHGVRGELNLNRATGTLRLHPSDWSWVNYGFLAITMHFWPQGTRGEWAIYLAETKSEDDIASSGRSYGPLTARFPHDRCDTFSFPFEADDPRVTPVGLSSLGVRDELQALIGTEPVPGSWNDGRAASVVTTLGEATDVCGADGVLAFDVPLIITSDDGRLRIDELAHAVVAYDGGTMERAWVDYYGKTLYSRASFAEQTGISGVEFGDVPRAYWHEELYLVRGKEIAPNGHVTVEGVSADGVVVGPLAKFDWWK
jgi:hypothetical protein